MTACTLTHAIQNEFFELAVRKGIFTNRRNLINHLRFMFGNASLQGRHVLDVGGGAGLLTHFAAVEEAHAICLEPEFEGSSRGMIERFNRFKAELPSVGGDSRIETLTFQDFHTDHQFDFLVLANSINHLDEPNCERLHRDDAAQRVYRAYFQKMYDLLNPGGRVIITDCDRTNFFNQIGMVSPFMKTIEWHKHQSPGLWMKLLQSVGFEPVSIRWSVPNRFGSLGRLVLGNRLVAYFLLSHFRLEVAKPLLADK